MPRSSDNGVSEWGGEGSKPPRRRRRERGCSAAGTQLPRAMAEETPPAHHPAPTDLAKLLALGELLEGIALGTLGAGVQGRGRHPAPQSPPPPPPAPRRGPTGNSGAAAAAARAAGSSSSPSPAPTRALTRETKVLETQPSPSASTSAPAHPVTPSQQLPLRSRERRRETKRIVRCGLAARRRIRFLLGLPSPPLIGWGGYCVTRSLRPTPNPRYAGSSHKGRKSLANKSPTLSARESLFKLTPPKGPGRGFS